MEHGTLTDQYRKEVFSIIDDICTNEKQSILAAARAVADQVKKDRLVYIFGPGGHSNMSAQEIFFRAGSLMNVSAMLNTDTMLSHGAMKSMYTERLPGFGRIVVEDYGVGEGDLLIVANAYGINAATIDAALTAKERGATVIGVSSRAHAEQASPDHVARHPSKKNLHDIVDYAIDVKVVTGDAVIRIPGLSQTIGALSTFANSFALNTMIIEAVNMLVEDGVDPPIWRSGNAPGGDEWNLKLTPRFKDRVRCL